MVDKRREELERRVCGGITAIMNLKQSYMSGYIIEGAFRR